MMLNRAKASTQEPKQVRMRSGLFPRLRRVSPVSLVLGLQLMVLLLFSRLEWSRFALQGDFSAYYQPWVMIAHGHWNPPETAYNVRFFYQDHFALLMWVLAPLYWVWPHGDSLLWMQDMWAVGSEWIAWQLIVDVIQKTAPAPRRRVMYLGSLMILVANPWTYWGTAFDFHPYTWGAFWSMLSLYSFRKGKPRSGYVYAFLTLLGGDVVATYLWGVSVTLALLGMKKDKTHAAILAGFPLALWVLFAIVLKQSGPIHPTLPNAIAASHTNVGFLHFYGYIAGPHRLTIHNLLIGFFFHPSRWLGLLWTRRLSIYSVIAPLGFVGLLTPWGLGVPFVVLAQIFLPQSSRFTMDFAQLFPVYAPMIIGTVVFVVKLGTRYPRLHSVLWMLVVINTLGWSAVWIPDWYPNWIDVSRAAAHTLHTIEGGISLKNEVVMSAGITGRFSNRHWVYPTFMPAIPLHTQITDIIITPGQGQHASSPNAILSRIGYLSRNPNAQLLLHHNGVWLFRYTRTTGVRFLLFPKHGSVPAWSVSSVHGVSNLSGAPSQWHLSSNGHKGTLMNSAWALKPGGQRLELTFSSGGPVTVVVTGATGNGKALQWQLPKAPHVITKSLRFDNVVKPVFNEIIGPRPFFVSRTSPARYSVVNVQIRVHRHEIVNVYRLAISQLRTK